MDDLLLGRTADKLQALALAPDRWPDVLQALSDGAGASGANLLSNSNRLPGVPCSPDFAPVLRTYFAEGWNTSDPRFRALPKALRTGIVSDEDCISADEMRTSPYYARLENYDLRWFAAITVMVDNEFWCVSLQRSIRRGPFEAEELARLSTLCRPLSEMATLSRTVGMARASGLAEAMEIARHPAMVLDEAGRVLAMNALVDPLLGVTVDVTRGTPMLFDRVSQARFDSLLKRTLARDLIKGPVQTVVTLRTKVGALTSLRMVALRDWSRYSFANASVLVTFEKTQATDADAFAAVGSAFGLTPNELRLARVLVAGGSLAEAAAQFGVSYETVRTHLKGLLRKTETSRQAEFIALIRSLSDV